MLFDSYIGTIQQTVVYAYLRQIYGFIELDIHTWIYRKEKGNNLEEEEEHRRSKEDEPREPPSKPQYSTQQELSVLTSVDRFSFPIMQLELLALLATSYNQPSVQCSPPCTLLPMHALHCALPQSREGTQPQPCIQPHSTVYQLCRLRKRNDDKSGYLIS